MPRPRDSQRARVYAAERDPAFGLSAPFRAVDFASLAEAAAFLADVLTRPTVRRRWPETSAGPVTLLPRRGSGAMAYPVLRRITWGRNLPLSKLLLLHELAHILAPAGSRHNAPWVATYVALVRIILGPALARSLQASFRAHRVKTRVVRRRPLTPEARAVLTARLAAMRAARAAA